MSLKGIRGWGTQSKPKLPLRVATLKNKRHETTCDRVTSFWLTLSSTCKLNPSPYPEDGDMTGASTATETCRVAVFFLDVELHTSPPCRSASCLSANSRANSSRPAQHPRTSDAAPASRDPLHTTHYPIKDPFHGSGAWHTQ